MYEDIYNAYHLGVKPPPLTKAQIKPCLKELKCYKVTKLERKEAVAMALKQNKEHKNA